MGRLIIEAAEAADDLAVSACISHAGSPHLGKPLADIFPGSAADVSMSCLDGCDLGDSRVMVDFSVPDAAVANARAAAGAGLALVVGTTGLTDEQRAGVLGVASEVPVLVASNTSIGVLVLHRLVRECCRSLPASFDIEVVETHHRNKVDAPSGTALALGETACGALGAEMEDVAVYGRAPGASSKRAQGEIGFSSVRGGDVAGEHSVMFISPSETVEVTHRAMRRSIFAEGALAAARFVSRAPAGAYSMEDILERPEA